MSLQNPNSFSGNQRPNSAAKPARFAVIATAIAMIAVIVLVFGGAAFALANRQQPTLSIDVPNDYPTIQAAIDAAQPGDVIRVRAGTYNESLTIDKAVTLTAESFDTINPTRNATVIDGGTASATIMIPSGLTQMPAVRGFVIRGGQNGIEAQSQFIAEYNYFDASGLQVEYQAGAGGSNRGNVYFHAGSSAIQIEDPGRPLLIENNRILYAGSDAIQIDLKDPAAPPALTEIDIWNNMLIGSAQDAIQMIEYPGKPPQTNRRFVIAGNLLANSQRAAIGLMPDAKTTEDYSGAASAEAFWVYNNTFYGNDYGISGGANLVAFNNIIANTTSRGVWRLQGAPGSNSVIAFTLFFGNRLDSDQSTLGAGNIIGQDPLFVAAPNAGADGVWGTLDDDFSGLLLQARSPAIDQGVTQYTSSSGEVIPPSPLTGYTGAAPDLGWREFGSPMFMTPTPSAIPSPTLAVTATALSPTAVVTGTNTPIPVTPTTTGAAPTNTPATPTAGSTTPTSMPTSGSTVTSTPAVTLQGVLPSSAPAGATVNLTVTGTGFQSGVTVAFEGGEGPAPQVTALQLVNATALLVTVDVKNSGTNPTVWSLRVTNPDGSSFVLENAFTVTP